jgi:hypothetical protein
MINPTVKKIFLPYENAAQNVISWIVPVGVGLILGVTGSLGPLVGVGMGVASALFVNAIQWRLTN